MDIKNHIVILDNIYRALDSISVFGHQNAQIYSNAMGALKQEILNIANQENNQKENTES